MNVSTLIDALVRQTTVLIAQLATTGGGRAQLAHTANQVFLDLVAALKEQGLGSKVIADMFGLALRTYHSKVQRLSESQSVRGRTLWEALFECIQTQGPIKREAILHRFRQDDPISVRGVLKDLVDSGVVYRTGRGDHTRYHPAGDPSTEETNDGRLQHFVWLAVHRLGPVAREELEQTLSLEAALVDRALQQLVLDGRVRLASSSPERFTSDGCVQPIEDPLGWEAALFDHYQAMVTAICTKLRTGATRARSADLIGGSTYSYRVWPGHPHFTEATAFLTQFRRNASALRESIANYNRSHPEPESGSTRVIVYAGQTLVSTEDMEADLEIETDD